MNKWFYLVIAGASFERLEPADRRYKALAFNGLQDHRVRFIGQLAGVVRRVSAQVVRGAD